jgi:hypothetical protein
MCECTSCRQARSSGKPPAQARVLSRVPAPVFSSPGVLASPSHKLLKLNHTSLPPQTASWSLAFWLNLLEDSSGHYRPLFFKSHGGPERTPSAWLLPDSNRITLRATTAEEADLGRFVLKGLGA